MKHNINSIKKCDLTSITGKIKLVSVVLTAAVVFSVFSSASLASVDINTEASLSQPQVTGTFSVSPETAGSYVEPTNTFSDGNPAYYLVTQDASKSAWTSVTYGGVDYPLTGVKVGSDINAMGSVFAANTTVFFDSGTYNDSDATAYVRLSVSNLSLIGLNGASDTIITKSAHLDGTIERYIINAGDIYFDGITFDGLGRNMCASAVAGQYGNNRGNYYFYFSTSSNNFVMKDCIIQNVGSNNSSTAKNLAINIYTSSGQRNFENLQIFNVKTAATLGIISSNDSTNNFFKNLTVDGVNAPNAYSVKLETNTPSAAPYASCLNVFSGNLSLKQTGNLGNVYIQDYRYKSTVLPVNYRYAQYSTINGNFGRSAVNVFSSCPAAAVNKAVLDLTDNYWIVQTGSSVSVSSQMTYIKTCISAVAAAGGSVPAANIKLVSNGGVLPGFTVPDMGTADVSVVAVSSISDVYNSTAMIPFLAGAVISLPAANADVIKLYNIDFSSSAKYTLQEAVLGIVPASVSLTDPNESGLITGYPVYSTYSAAAAAKVTHAEADTFVNCRFTALTNKIEVTNAAAKLGVGNSMTFTAGLADIADNSYTGTGYTSSLKDLADDKTIHWFSSDPSIVSIDPSTGEATALQAGTVTITAKAMDANNSGEIEKPYASFQLNAAAVFHVTYNGNGSSSGSLLNPDNVCLDGDTHVVLGKDTLEKAGSVFAGWNTEDDGSGTTYQPGDTLQVNGNVDLFAVWEVIPPTITPTDVPTVIPTDVPTVVPTVEPTVAPTIVPTVVPTVIPTVAPTVSPTPAVSPVPALSPTPGSGVLGADRSTTPTPASSDVLGADRSSNSSVTKTGEQPDLLVFGGFAALIPGVFLLYEVNRRKRKAK